MATHATLKAHLLPTSTSCNFLESTSFFDVSIAASFRAPFELRVQIYINVQLESQVLLVKLLGSKTADIVFFKSLGAAHHHAWDLDYISVANVHIQMVRETNLAEIMRT